MLRDGFVVGLEERLPGADKEATVDICRSRKAALVPAG